jgi:hypothetical protein
MGNKKREKSAPYIGVSRGQKKWITRIKYNNETVLLGYYDDVKDAAKAYDLFVIKNNLDRPTNFFKKKLV